MPPQPPNQSSITLEGTLPSCAPLKVFYCYARADSRWLRELRMSLIEMKRENLIQDWYDEEVLAGSDFNAEIRAKLDESDLILLLVDILFLNSDYIYQHELPRMLELEGQDLAHVIPVLLRAFENWRTHFLFHGRQGVPWDDKGRDRGVLECSNRWRAWKEVAENIRKVVLDRWEKKYRRKYSQEPTKSATKRTDLFAHPSEDEETPNYQLATEDMLCLLIMLHMIQHPTSRAAHYTSKTMIVGTGHE